jgi:hypothetical protein
MHTHIYIYAYIHTYIYADESHMCTCQDKVSSLEAALSEAARDSVSESARTARIESALRQEIHTLSVCSFIYVHVCGEKRVRVVFMCVREICPKMSELHA